MLSVGERDASVVRTGPKSSAIITAPSEKCGLGKLLIHQSFPCGT